MLCPPQNLPLQGLAGSGSTWHHRGGCWEPQIGTQARRPCAPSVRLHHSLVGQAGAVGSCRGLQYLGHLGQVRLQQAALRRPLSLPLPPPHMADFHSSPGREGSSR